MYSCILPRSRCYNSGLRIPCCHSCTSDTRLSFRSLFSRSSRSDTSLPLPLDPHTHTAAAAAPYSLRAPSSCSAARFRRIRITPLTNRLPTTSARHTPLPRTPVFPSSYDCRLPACSRCSLNSRSFLRTRTGNLRSLPRLPYFRSPSRSPQTHTSAALRIRSPALCSSARSPYIRN